MSGRKNKYLGKVGAAALRLRLQGQESRRFRRRLASQLPRHRTLLRQGGFVSRHHGRDGKLAASSRRRISAAAEIELCRGDPETKSAKNGSRVDAVPRRRHQRRTEA